MIKPSELAPRFSALLNEADRANIRRHRDGRHRHRGRDRAGLRSAALRPSDLHRLDPRSGGWSRKPPARNLTPVTLELGGKSPAIVDRSADLDEAAERIAYGKLLNAGQTCIAPDYVLVPRSSVQDFAEKLQASMRRMFGTDPANKDYTSIVSDRHYAAAGKPGADAAAKGAADRASRQSPTIPHGNEAQISADASSSARRPT